MSTISSIFLTLFLFTVTACEEETLLEPLALKNNSYSTDCNYSLYDEAIAETQQAYQAFANSICDTLFVDIICCHDGFETHALVIVVPKGLPCPPKVSTDIYE